MLLLWGFYALFLEKENMHYIKRFYLISSVIFSLTIPLVTFTYQTDIVFDTPGLDQPTPTVMALPDEISEIKPSVDYRSLFLWSIYGLGVLIFGIRCIKNLVRLTKKIKINDQLKESSHTNVLVNDSIIPHTFLKFIFLPKKEYKENKIPEEVLQHEKTHVIQKHTLDILFIEILQVIFWCNPILIWIKKSIKLNHEFLADQTVLKCQFSLQNYMSLLVTYPNSSNQTELSSPINYSLTKKRILMMSQQFSKTRAAARLLLLLPIVLGCMLLFNNEIVAQQKNVSYAKTIQDTHPDKKIKIRVKGEQITVNNTVANLSNFANIVDEKTKQWKDNELTEFQFDIQIMNSDDGFVKKLNDAYRKTRLYTANPGGHDLIPPAPPEPEIPNIEIDDVPSPAPAPKVSGVTNAVIPPSPPEAPVPPINSSQTEENINVEIEQAMVEAEQARIEAEIARNSAEVEHEYEIASAVEAAEHARAIAIEEAQLGREMAMLQAENAREVAERARAIAMEAAHRSKKHAHLAREEAMKHAQLAREHAQKAIHESHKAHDKVRKQTEKARKKARKAMEEARQEQQKAREKAKKAKNI